MDKKIYDIIIIGGGCAGLTAAIYARRASKSVLLFENNAYGGQISSSPAVENYPGFINISGIDLSDTLYNQAVALGTETVFDNVNKVSEDKIKTVTANYGEYYAKAVIIAVGMKHRTTGIKNEQKLLGRGVSYCAVCDGAFYKNKDVAVLGGGNTAIQDAIYLSDICKSVTVIHRRDTFTADPFTLERLKDKNNIIYKLNCILSEITGEKSLSSVTITDKNTDVKDIINLDGLFIAIGQLPQNDKFKNVVKLDNSGFINADESCKTSTEGIFAAGDCRAKNIRQIVTATSDGAIAASSACKYLDLL